MDKGSLSEQNGFPDKEKLSALEVCGAYNSHIDISGINEQKLMRKIDLVLVPWFSFLYLLNFLDRASIGNAKLYHLVSDLRLTDSQYLLVLTAFFLSYSIFQAPSNILLKRLRPSLWFPFLTLMCGILMVLHGIVHNYGELLSIRWLSGVFEAGLYPGASFMLSCWYKRSELGFRAAIFFSAATASGAFGGLLAVLISKMDGVGGKPAWAWIFIIQGLISAVAGVASFFIVQDFPDTAGILNEAERTVVVRRLQGDDQFSAGGEDFRWKSITQGLTDWKTWIGLFVYGGATMPMYALTLFLPSILNQLGYHATVANSLTIPVYLAACIVTCAVGYASGRWGNRGYINLVLFIFAAVAYIILIFSRSAPLSYFAVYLAACSLYPMIPNTTSWVSSNVEGSYKRGTALAFVSGLGNINGAVSANVYRAKDQPWFGLGHGLVLMYILMGLTFNVILIVLLKRENSKRDQGERTEVIGLGDGEANGGNEKNGRFATIDDARREKGDNWSGYRYSI